MLHWAKSYWSMMMAIAPKKNYFILLNLHGGNGLKFNEGSGANVSWSLLRVTICIVFYNFLFMDKREGVNSDSESLTQSCIFWK